MIMYKNIFVFIVFLIGCTNIWSQNIGSSKSDKRRKIEYLSGSSGACYKEFNKLLNYYEQQKLNQNEYYKFYSYNEVNGIVGEKILTESWYDGERYKYQNPFMTLYQDKNNKVLILNDREMILISNSVEIKHSKKVEFDFRAQIDSVIKLADKVTCEELNKTIKIITVYLPQKVNNSINKYKTIKHYFEKKTGKLTKSVYEYYTGTKDTKKDIIEYLEIQTSFDESELLLKAKDYVLSKKGQLKKEYSGYELVDQRIKK